MFTVIIKEVLSFLVADAAKYLPGLETELLTKLNTFISSELTSRGLTATIVTPTVPPTAA
jgi:hypothetical protein